MYCVKCGVKLSDDLNVCPLCQTKVYYNEEHIAVNKEKKYPETMPTKNHANKSLASILTMLSLLATSIILILCYQLMMKSDGVGMPFCLLVYFIVFSFCLYGLKNIIQ
jgi:uncharacterized membrane protein YvbJ